MIIIRMPASYLLFFVGCLSVNLADFFGWLYQKCMAASSLVQGEAGRKWWHGPWSNCLKVEELTDYLHELERKDI